MTKDNKNLHVKPTVEELEENANKAVEEAEKLKNTPKKPEETPKKPEPTLSEEESPKPESKEPEPDYKKKAIEQARENIILHSKNKKTNEALEKAMGLPNPTDEEIQKEYPDWELMSEFEKRMARESASNKRRMKVLSEIATENKDLEVWQGKVDSFIDDPKTLIDNPNLEGRQDEFRLFATKLSRRGVDFPDLVSAFLYQTETKKPNKKKGAMFEVGSGGPNDRAKPKADILTIEEGRNLRKTDYKKYSEYLKAGKIATE